MQLFQQKKKTLINCSKKFLVPVQLKSFLPVESAGFVRKEFGGHFGACPSECGLSEKNRERMIGPVFCTHLFGYQIRFLLELFTTEVEILGSSRK